MIVVVTVEIFQKQVEQVWSAQILLSMAVMASMV